MPISTLWERHVWHLDCFNRIQDLQILCRGYTTDAQPAFGFDILNEGNTTDLCNARRQGSTLPILSTSSPGQRRSAQTELRFAIEKCMSGLTAATAANAARL
eukprot:scaffold36083_cov19-Tisochrysis_lutea.AAC.2